MAEVNKPQHLAFRLLDFLNEFADSEGTKVESVIAFDKADFWINLDGQEVRIQLGLIQPQH